MLQAERIVILRARGVIQFRSVQISHLCVKNFPETLQAKQQSCTPFPVFDYVVNPATLICSSLCQNSLYMCLISHQTEFPFAIHHCATVPVATPGVGVTLFYFLLLPSGRLEHVPGERMRRVQSFPYNARGITHLDGMKMFSLTPHILREEWVSFLFTFL